MSRQYSLLGLFAFTTAIALYLTFANHYPKLAIALVIGGGMWAGTLLVVDLLVRLVRLRPFEFLTVAAWGAVGSLFLLMGTMFLLPSLALIMHGKSLADVMGSASGVVGASLACGAILCYFSALRSLMRSRRDNQLPPAPSDRPNLSR